MASPEFLTWLKHEARYRGDEVGLVARTLAADECLTARMVPHVIAHREQVHNASPEEIGAIQMAAGEYYTIIQKRSKR